MNLDPVADFIVQAQRDQANAQAEAEPERETRLRPHEIHRKPRQMNVTFPTSAWTEAIREVARLRGLRPTDLVVWCVSYAISRVQAGEVTAPDGKGRKQHHTACEWMDDLPWEPERKVTDPPQKPSKAFDAAKIG